MIVRKGAAILAFASLIASSPASAQAEQPMAESGSGGQVTVYGWLAGATGEITPFEGAPTLEFDNSFNDVLADLDAAFFISGLYRSGDLVVVGDFSYASLSREGQVPPGIPASGNLDQLSTTLAAGSRVSRTDEMTIDVLAGARLWDVSAQIDVPLAGVSESPGRTFVDPIVATRVNLQIAPQLSVLFYGDVGGLGVGSDFTYQALASFNYRIARRSHLSVGYRHLHLDYDDDGTEFRGSQTGPVIGFTQSF